MSPRLERIEERLALVLRGPDAVESQLLFKITRGILSVAGWRASMKVEALTALIDQLKAKTYDEKMLTRATGELEDNVSAIERVAIVKKKTPIAHALWLRRVAGILALAEIAIESKSEEDARVIIRTDSSALLPPLAPVRKGAKDGIELGTKALPEVEDQRLVDLELAAIDHLFAAARAETLLLGRKRRLLVAARQRLLEASAALPLGSSGINARTRHIAREITRIDRLEAAGLSTDVSLLHQARQALTRRDPRKLYAAVAAIDAAALAAGDQQTSRSSGRALKNIGYADPAKSLERSGREILGDVAQDVEAAVDEARADAQTRAALGNVPSEKFGAENLLKYLPADAGLSIVRAATLADGLFEVGGALSPLRVAEEERVMRMVRHPTQALVLMPATDISDVKDAIIDDPRSILLDLATGRLLARRYVKEETRQREKIIMRGEVRVYVLDGSGSMVGNRARVRDAILVAELATLKHRLQEPGQYRCTLYYQYFNEDLGLEKRCKSTKEVDEAIRDVVTNERTGGTDIQLALLASLNRIAEAQATDPDLARGQIVLVTDGEADVSEEVIVAARDRIPMRVGVSVVAIGQENEALKKIVAHQRAKGEAAFYHFVDDAELAQITSGMVSLEDAIHPPDRWLAGNVAQALDEEVGGLLDELEGLDRERDVAALERIEEEAQARREAGVTEDEESHDGERARVEAMQRDRIALAARYERWFPLQVTPTPTELPKAGSRERDDIEATCAALASVAEVVALLGGSQLARQADAIELLERLLPDARLSPAKYRAVLREYPDVVAPALRALRDAVDGVAN